MAGGVCDVVAAAELLRHADREIDVPLLATRTSSPFFALTWVSNPSVVVATMRAGVCASPGQYEMPRGE